MGKHISKYYLEATIVNPTVIARTQEFTDGATGLLGLVSRVIKELHITIIPPFYTDYETASQINLSCAMSTLRSTHPLITTQFSIRGLEIMSFGEVDVLHLPVSVHQEASPNQRFADYVVAIRKKALTLGLDFKEAIPEEYTPHITVLTGSNLRDNAHLEEYIKKSLVHTPVIFRSGYPSLYARYEEGWKDLSKDPSLFEK